MIAFPSRDDLATLCSKLGVLAFLLLGTPMSAATQPTASFDLFPSASTEGPEATFAASTASLPGDVSQISAAIGRARSELQATTRVLGQLESRDAAADEYIEAVQLILAWVDRPGADLLMDAATLATSLEAARLRFSERTTSLKYWLAMNRSEADTTPVPLRFVVTLTHVDEETPDYHARRHARALLA